MTTRGFAWHRPAPSFPEELQTWVEALRGDIDECPRCGAPGAFPCFIHRMRVDALATALLKLRAAAKPKAQGCASGIPVAFKVGSPPRWLLNRLTLRADDGLLLTQGLGDPEAK